MSFYEGLLKWKYRQMQNSPESEYVMIEEEGKLIGGLRRVQKPIASADSSCPIVYLSVANLTACVKRAKELGAGIVGEIVELGHDRGRYQWIRDRTGNLIGLWSRG